MSLKIYVRQFSRIIHRGDKVVKVTFRGVSQTTRVIEDTGEEVIFDEVLEWPVAREIDAFDEIKIELELNNRYLANRLLAVYTCVLQRLVQQGAIAVTDHMTDANNKLIKTLVSFEARYLPPPGPHWETGIRTIQPEADKNPAGVRLLERETSIGSELDYDMKGRRKSASEENGKHKKMNKEELTKGISDDEQSASRRSSKHRLPKRSMSTSDGERPQKGLFSRIKNSKALQAEKMSKRTKSREKLIGTPRGSDAGIDYVPNLDFEDGQNILLQDVEQNIANIERNLNLQERISTEVKGRKSTTASPETPKKSSRGFVGMKAVRSLVRLGRQRSKSSDDEEKYILKDPQTNFDDLPPRPASVCSINSEAESTHSLPILENKQNRINSDAVASTPAELKAQDFQLCVTIVEARQLAGLNMDPVVCVQVGDIKKYTSVKESTNCPYYNEYFVFDFHMAPAMLFDKIITLTVLQSRNILRSNKALGSFKLDVATVWAQSEHQFYHKWALLTDPDDITGGPKGYLKCDICVVGKGDALKIPLRNDKDEDDIEGNLLLPDGVPAERQRARFIIRVYRADGLPKINSSIMANVKKALTGDTKDLIDPYVQISFAGLTGRTGVKKSTASPVWNEQIVFTEMFPPLCQRVKIQLRDNDAVNDTVIGTHFLDLTTISNDGDKGFLPTFGPAYIYLYGSTRDGSIMDEHASLNAGLGEGIAYRGRLLISVRCQITDLLDVPLSEVEVENTAPLQESNICQTEEFLLFASIHEVTMIEKKISDKPVFLELSIGNAGNCLDGSSTNRPTSEDEDASDEESEDATYCPGTNSRISGFKNISSILTQGPESVHTESSMWQSTTPPMKPLTNDKIYFYLPFWDDKPCLYVRSFWQDHRRRLYNSNALATIAEKLEEGLNAVLSKMEDEECGAEKLLKEALEGLISSCSLYLSIAKASSTAHSHSSGKTKLDRERMKLCQREIESLSNSARHTKAIVTKSSMRERYKTAQGFLSKIKLLIEDPQNTLPDVFIWLISGNRRIAYQRIPIRQLIYSPVDPERGKYCGTSRTLFLKLPGRKSSGPGGWVIQAKLQIILWLGLNRHKKYLLSGIPKGYDLSYEIKNIERPSTLPPITLHYTEKQTFQLRAHVYQARSLIGSDASGLSDPFARVIFGEHCRITQVIDETLSPTWDELLIIDEVTVYGTKEEIKNDPPMVVIEIFDQDKVGKSEFIGRTLAKPRVRMKQDVYQLPKLEWYDLYRSLDHAGELLATFELIQFSEDEHCEDLSLPLSKDMYNQDCGPLYPVPRGIRPTLSKYRLEVLFWGLRDLKRIHLLTVDRPRVDVEIAGHIIQSSIINSAKKNPNFASPVKYIDLELPEQELYCPPITIRVVDCRSFGRFTLVGTHIISNLHRYMWNPITKRDREAAAKKSALLQQQELLEINDTHYGNQKAMLTNDTKAKRMGGAVRVTNKKKEDNLSLKVDCEASPLLTKETIITIDYGTGAVSKLAGITKKEKTEANKRRKQSLELEEDDEEHRDWWTKYFASLEHHHLTVESAKKQQETEDGEQINASNHSNQQSNTDTTRDHMAYDKKRTHLHFKSTSTAAKFAARCSPKTQRKKSGKNIALMKILTGELEAEFNDFREWLHTFDLYRGKKTGDDMDDEGRVVGKFKGSLKLYKYPLPLDIDEPTIMGGGDPSHGFFQGIPSNDPIHVMVRIYIIRACDLHPMDLNGKADPYIVMQLGNKKISDKENYISKQLKPVFGKCFEVEATFPQDSMLTISVLDWDLVGSDDLIGDTKIDLENRFYSRHRATCGIATRYEKTGYNQWRDPMKPTQILSRLCKDAKIDGPNYGPGKVTIGSKTFTVNQDAEIDLLRSRTKDKIKIKTYHQDYTHSGYGITEEQLALAVLHQWSEIPKVGCALVPEHVETRSLYKPEKPGIEQGKLEMWVDMFPMDMPLPGPTIDVTPRKPKSYELRVIIWNTDDVVLEDDAFFTGEKMSDIYVKGWLKGPEDTQCTDIHYRSLTGEGNFNWRFIFPFEYLVAEEKIVISRKESLFSWDETECKIPARLELQVWDADHFSADDFLGAITLDLNRFPRGAKSSKQCTLQMLKNDQSVPMVNIFKQRRVKGWWPFYIKKENEQMELTGKVEAEMHLLTREEAEKNPAGLGRNEPDPLEKPNRPDASFMWFLNPIKSIRYIVWHNYKWVIIKFLIFIAVAVFFILFLYSIPGFTVKKIIGA